MPKKRLKLSYTALDVLKKRYLLKDNKGKIIETPEQMFKRVAKVVAKGNKRMEKELFNLMYNLDFLPNSPTLMNAGNINQLSACFVLPIEDSIESIFETLKNAAIIHQSGGGTGFSFSRIRPKNDIVTSTKGTASGPVSFMEVYDKATDVIKQGGKRRGANIAVLRVDHPDILEFISLKRREPLSNFNISVGITDKFMKAVNKDTSFNLINPRTKRTVKKIKAREIFNAIVENAWANGDPGILFLDEINRKNTLKSGRIESTNPCGEQPLYPYESCNLGSINLSNMANSLGVDWCKLKKTARLAVKFLDNIIDINNYPLKDIEKITKANRKIGLGVMGFAEMLVKLKIPYNSEKAIHTAEKVMKFINKEARGKSYELAKEKDSFPNFRKSKLRKYRYMRNATVTTIAPTGTLSIIANTSSSIEPLFAVIFTRQILGHKKFFEVNEVFKDIAVKRKFWSEKLMKEISSHWSIQHINKIPKDVRILFATAMDIKPEQHVKIQAAFQKYTDNAVSKTVNLPNNATKRHVRDIFLLAYKLKCKGITVYRHGSKENQVFTCEAC